MIILLMYGEKSANRYSTQMLNKRELLKPNSNFTNIHSRALRLAIVKIDIYIKKTFRGANIY